MNHQTGLSRAVFVALGVVAAASLAGCGNNANPQAQATPANMSMATSAATAQLPPGEAAQPMANGAQAPTAAPPAAPAAGPQFAQVVAVQPITQSSTTSKPRQVCRDEQVSVPEPYKDKHQIGGAVVGGLAGGLLGNQVGGGKGKTLATVGGAVAGGYVGNKVQKNAQDKKTYYTTERRCRTVYD